MARQNTHWQAFALDVPWFVKDRQIDVGNLLPPGSWQPSNTVARLFPRLGRLLAGAHTSHVAIDEEPFTLFSWERVDRILAWLAPRPEPAAQGLYPSHQALIREFGGITERAGEFDDQWLLNTTESLTWREARKDASFIRDYAWAFEGVSGGIPIDLAAYYCLSREANGNCTLCHRIGGDVLLFAPDHSFDYVTPLEGCPEYTFYRLRGAPRFEDWVEAVAEQWATGGTSAPHRMAAGVRHSLDKSTRDCHSPVAFLPEGNRCRTIVRVVTVPWTCDRARSTC